MLFRRSDRSPRTRHHTIVGGSAQNLNSLGQSPHHQHSRSERDLTKVTKVRVRTSGGGGGSKDQLDPNGKRTKMKTTTMIVNDDGSNNVVMMPVNHAGQQQHHMYPQQQQQQQQQPLALSTVDVVR